MQENSMAEKDIVEFDGVDIPGLVNISERKREKAGIEVPSYKKIRTISNGVTKIPPFDLTYRYDRGTNTLSYFETWFDDNEVKDGVLIKHDAHGSEFERILLPKCECLAITEPAYDAASPGYAQITVTIAPWDYIPIEI